MKIKNPFVLKVSDWRQWAIIVLIGQVYNLLTIVPLIKVLLWADSLESYLKPTILIKSYCIAKYEHSIVDQVISLFSIQYINMLHKPYKTSLVLD